MPYKVYRTGSDRRPFCVHKLRADGTRGERVAGGCHSTRSDANAHQRALEAATADEESR